MSSHSYVANPDRMAAQVIADVVAPPPPIDFNTWAVDNLVFGSESPIKGRYDPERFPFFRRILEVLGPDHPARTVVFSKSAQLGGTVLAQIFLGGSTDLDPGPFLYTHPTEGNATRWARTKWRPMIRQCDALKGLFGAAATREGGNSILYQERTDGRGFVQISGANSEASLSMLSVPRQVQDDLAKWELNNAGDPETQADSRSKAFDWAKIFKIGTPLIEDNCRVTRNFKRSTQEHYHVPCPHCGVFQKLEWENMLATLDESDPASAHFTCTSCAEPIEEKHKPWMLTEGQWIADNPGASIVGFHLWSAYSPLERWAQIAERYFHAKGDPAREQAFENDDLGRAYKSAGESPPWEVIRDRATRDGLRRGVVPMGGLLLVLAMDCQDDRVECHLKAFGRDLKRWTVDYFVVEGHISDLEVQKRLDKEIVRVWPNFQRGARTIDLAVIDGGAYTADVFEWVKRHPASKVIMVRGVPGDAADPLVLVKRERTRDGRIRKYQRRFFNVGASPIKVGLYKNLAKDDPLERGYCAHPVGMEDDFYEQQTAERRRPVQKKDGFTRYEWVKAPGARNEVLDTEVYAEAGAIRLGWRLKSEAAWDVLEAEREALPPAGQQLDIEELIISGGASAMPAVPEVKDRLAAARQRAIEQARRAKGSGS